MSLSANLQTFYYILKTYMIFLLSTHGSFIKKYTVGWRWWICFVNLPEPPRGSLYVGILSPHGALRAYTVLLTAEPRRGSTLVSSSLVTISGCRTMCLPWVTYSLKSPTFLDNVVFLLSLLYILNERAVMRF